MAFNIWQIGLHIQQHEVLAVAVVRDASGWFLQRWWRLPLAKPDDCRRAHSRT